MKQHINFATKHLVILQIKTNYTGLTIWLGKFFQFSVILWVVCFLCCLFCGLSVSCVVCFVGCPFLIDSSVFSIMYLSKCFKKHWRIISLFFSSKSQCTANDKLLSDKNVLFFCNKLMHPLLKMTHVILLLPWVRVILETAVSLWT